MRSITSGCKTWKKLEKTAHFAKNVKVQSKKKRCSAFQCRNALSGVPREELWYAWDLRPDGKQREIRFERRQQAVKQGKKRKKRQEEVYDDEEFMFIAGYTEGGAPYGVTWEEMGIDPDLPLEEKRKLAKEQDAPRGNQDDDDLERLFD